MKPIILLFLLLLCSASKVCGTFSDYDQGQPIETRYMFISDAYGSPLLLRTIDVVEQDNTTERLLAYGVASNSRLSPHESIENGYYMEPLGAGFIIYDANYCNQIMRCSVPLKDGLYIDLEKETCDSYDSQLSLARPSRKRVSERLYSIIYMNDQDQLIYDQNVYDRIDTKGCESYYVKNVIFTIVCGSLLCLFVFCLVWVIRDYTRAKYKEMKKNKDIETNKKGNKESHPPKDQVEPLIETV